MNGKVFERLFIEEMEFLSKKQWRCLDGFRSAIGSLSDYREGTDFFIGEIRFDLTISSAKDNLVILEERSAFATEAIGVANICVTIGIRTGNSYGTFENPVAVLWFEDGNASRGEFSSPTMDALMEAISDQQRLIGLLDEAVYGLEDWMEEMG